MAGSRAGYPTACSIQSEFILPLAWILLINKETYPSHPIGFKNFKLYQHNYEKSILLPAGRHGAVQPDIL